MNPRFGLEYSPGYVLLDTISRFMSPYQLNPFDLNPLRHLLNEVINFERVRQQKVVKLFLSATHVRSGKITVFSSSADARASRRLPPHPPLRPVRQRQA
jgi:NTE family protein